MSDWIDSGGHTPHPCADDDVSGNKDRENSQLRRRAWRLEAPLTIGFAVLLLGLASHLGYARVMAAMPVRR